MLWPVRFEQLLDGYQRMLQRSSTNPVHALVSTAMTTFTPGVSPTSCPAIASPQPLLSPVTPDPSTISPDKHAAKHDISMCAVQPNYWRVDSHDHHDQDHYMADEDYDADYVPANEDGQPRICPSSPSQAPLPSQVQPPLILHCPSDPTVQALGITASGNAIDRYPLDFQFTYSDLFRSRNSARGRCDLHDVDVDANDEDEEENGKQMTMSEAVWRKWEQVDGLAKCAGGLFRYAYDRDGNGESFRLAIFVSLFSYYLSWYSCRRKMLIPEP